MTAFDGYFLPSGTDSYTFTSTSYTKPIMFLNGFPVSFIQVRNNTGAPNAWASNENLRLAGNELYSLQLSKSAIKDLSFGAGKGTPASPLSPTLVAQRSVKQVSEVLVKLRRVAIPVSLCKLQREEIEYFQSLHGFNLTTLSFENIKLVSTYADLRNSLPKPGGKDAISPLTNFYKSLNECGTVEELVTLLVRTTGWPGAVIDAVLRAKYLPALTESQLVETFKHFPSLCQLRDVMGFMSRLRLEGLFPELLFSLADPALPQTLGVGVHGKAADKDFEDANRLRLALASRGASLSQPFAESDERLRANRRTALVQYLLQQEYIRKLDIHDPDALCEYLLIDVQMGPSLRTSRLKQATSTIQTFMQRCILGLEKRFGIPSSVISRDDYEYLGRYRLWEANRKTFMYPESWIDPTLRDDKTDQFRDLEAAITQGKVTEDSMAGVIRDYVFAMHEVGNLEVQGYVWGKEEDGKTSRLHLFGRTRTSPWKYYYRSVDIVENGKKSVTYWKPWERLSVEIQSHELTDNTPNKRADQPNDDGFDKFNKYTGSGCYMVPRVLDGRLILFLPQFTLVDLFDDESKKTTPTKMANEPVSKSTTMKQWQLQMGWTEYRNGKWTPKKLCPDVLLINGEINDYRPTETDDEKVEEQEEEIRKKLEAKLPGIQTFFFPDSYTWKGIAVQTWYGPLNPGCPIREEELYGKQQKKYYRFHYRSWGAFSWRGESLVLVRQRDWSVDEAVPTNFAKLAWPVTDGEDGNFLVPANGGLELPARSPTPKHEADNVFTLGLSRYYSSSVGGNVLDVVLQDGDSQCFIYYDSRWDSGKFSNLISSALVRAATRGTDELYSKLSSIDVDFYREHDDVFGKRDRMFPHELANPFSLYTWEVGVHAISLIMERFLSTQQYELALSAARFLFDPAAAGVDADFTKCWKFIPFQTLGIVLKHSGIMPDPKASVHAVAREWPAAYMKRVVLKYIEILIALGDELFRQNTLETIPLAIQRYIEAEHLFGPQPVNTPQLGKRKVWSYKKLMGGKIDEFSNFSVDLELELPFRWDSGDPKKLIPFINTAYFCIPANPQVAGLRALLNDRLYKCRNSLDIDGHKQNLALFEPAIDPDALLRAKAAGLSPSAVVGDLSSPMPRSRFVYLLEQALELCRELKEMEARVLAVKEKKDTEALAALSAKHNTAMLGLVMETKRAQKEEALAAIAVLEENRRSQIARLAFYLVLTGDQMPPLDGDAGWKEIPQSTGKPTADGLRISATERSEMVSAIQSNQYSEAGNELEQLARIFDALPAISLNFEPLGVGTTVECGPAIVARAMRIGVGEAMNRAQSSSDKSRMSNMVGRFESQLQERRELANQAGREIKVIDRMLAGARARVAACDKDIRQQQQQLDAAAEMEEWLRSKYTSVELYAWMDKQYGMLFQRGYSLTTALVRQAQRAYFFENPTDSSQFLNSAGYWDGARDGLLSAENMWLDLKKMDLAFRNKKSHDFEIVKNISLRQLNPWALVELRETGQTKFSLPEFLFDMDFPGHYCRRINSVSLTIPCIVGPYTSLNCTLRLCQHTYRISTDISLPYPEKMAGDLRFRTDSIPINAIAIGSPAPNDRSAQGSFSFGFVGNRYSPFEGAGAISTWQIELPPDLRQFEYRTISDVVLQLRYTALDGGSLFGNAASKSVMDAIKQQSSTALSMLVSIPSDYTSTWATFQSEMRSGKEGHLHLQDMPDRLPFWTQRRKIMVDSISVIVFPATEDLDLCKMTIGEYESLSWTKQDQGLGDGCMVFEAKPTGKELKQNWTVTVPNPDGKRVSLDALWVLVHYYVSAS
ncbi:putative PA14 domain protein [Rosellinia necatrix]|uniref:Putative PA14 domain protein n=1 Tax=Rosellinia necatrix TaxID=77044 RepID=A0A1S8A845_ROSNE|nr:putative PA14 domain protein [Rosellinia necatrix]